MIPQLVNGYSGKYTAGTVRRQEVADDKKSIKDWPTYSSRSLNDYLLHIAAS